jgi:hypothetical protein
MSIRFSCRCGRKLKVSDEKIGTKVLCSSCGATLKVPKKSQDEYWQDVPTKDEAKVDYFGTAKELFVQALPGVLLIAVLVWGAYFLATQIVIGRGGLPDLGKVTGTVTYNGKPVANAMVRFIPLDTDGTELKGHKATTAIGLTDANGRFTMLYVKDTPGAAVGPNKISIEATDSKGHQIFPPEYNRNSTLTRDVQSGSNDFKLDIKGPDVASDGSTPPTATQP